MLRYTLTSENIENDVVTVQYDNVTLTDYVDAFGDGMCVNITCHDNVDVRPGVKVQASKTHALSQPEESTIVSEFETASYAVHSVDVATNSFSVIAAKYKVLDCESMTMEPDNDGVYCLYVTFRQKHLLEGYSVVEEENEDDTDVIDEENTVDNNNMIYVYYNQTDYARLYGFDVVDLYTISWPVDFDTENFSAMAEVVFPEWDGSDTVTAQYGNVSDITVRRIQTMWSDSSDTEVLNPQITYVSPRIYVHVPFSLKTDTRLNMEMNVKERFVDEGVANSINRTPEMEKYVYRPVYINGGSSDSTYTFGCVRKINFNMHFRTHSGDNWVVENGDSWNFITYGTGSDAYGYYSYDSSTRSNQADLLVYAGFTNNDVKYQKNRLKKSFIRLSFYDSDRPGDQTLLSYATVFMDCGELYSRYMNGSDADIYKNIDGETLTGIKVDREVNEAMLRDKLGLQDFPDDDTIERYRLSSRISVTDPMMSSNSSEGFNVYLWADNDNGILPSDLYMKVEFNHAGYGRVIPMMAPYRTVGSNPGFKTNSEIIADWSDQDTQYGILRYRKYSYIKFKYKYDKTSGKHIYYLDPERYGKGEEFSDVININLYEARVAFNDA